MSRKQPFGDAGAISHLRDTNYEEFLKIEAVKNDLYKVRYHKPEPEDI